MMWNHNPSIGGINLVPEEEMDYQQRNNSGNNHHHQHHQVDNNHDLTQFYEQHMRLTLDGTANNNVTTNTTNIGGGGGNGLTSAFSQASLSFTNSQRSLGRSQSMSSVSHAHSASNHNKAVNKSGNTQNTSSGSTMMNETFRLGSYNGNGNGGYSHGNGGAGLQQQQQHQQGMNSNNPFLDARNGGQQGNHHEGNLFLDNSKVSSVLAAVAARQQQQHQGIQLHPSQQQVVAASACTSRSSSAATLTRQHMSASGLASGLSSQGMNVVGLSGASGFTPLGAPSKNSLASITNVPSAASIGSAHQQQQQQQVRQLQQQQRHNNSLHNQPSQLMCSILTESPNSTAASVSGDERSVGMAPASNNRGGGGALTPIPMAADSSQNNISTGPSELYRLIASPPHEAPLDWNVILARAGSHPGEACFFDPSAGGHVYALHRLLRRTGGGDEDRTSRSSCRPPVEVVEAVMRACPRAVTRKQAVIDEDDLMSASVGSVGGNGGMVGVGGTMGANNQGGGPQQQLNQLQNMLLNFPPVINAPVRAPNNPAEDDDERQEPQNLDEDNDGADHDDVRFEYPLAIACECEQDIEIVRLLASTLAKTKPVYRSEVFRSLDYASLPNPVVRILLEEYAGCVLERGTNSEATEGDDDDCPLEQVLFWWDDPDMMGMEEDIAMYPNCNMCEDLCDLHEKLRMMLYAATMGTMSGYDSSKESFQVLHHVLRIVSDGGIGDVKFPNDFAHAVLLLAKFIQRERVGMFVERDESGALPLHIAVSGEGLLRQNDSRPREEGGEGNDQVENGEDENGDREAMEEVDQADGSAEGGAEHEQNNAPLPHQDQAAAQHAEDDEDDDELDDEDGDDLEETSTMPSDMEIVRLLLDQHPASIRLRDSQSGSLPIHLALQHNPRATEAIELFLDRYPRSVTMPDGNGRLPVHTALIQRSPMWNKVLDLSPIALETRDPVTSLLPFQLAAMSKTEAPSKDDDSKEAEMQQESEQEEFDSLTTTFRLLRMSPCLASGLADVKPRPQTLIERQVMVGYKPRVTKLEEENERLRRKVDELELKLMQMMSSSLSSDSSGTPSLKKRKSSCAEGGPFSFSPP